MRIHMENEMQDGEMWRVYQLMTREMIESERGRGVHVA